MPSLSMQEQSDHGPGQPDVVHRGRHADAVVAGGLRDRSTSCGRAYAVCPGRRVIAEHIDGAEEIHHERRRRMLDDLVDGAVLLDHAVVHDHDAVGELERLFLIVGDEHAGQVDLVVQPPQPAPQLLPDLGVERAERLVEQQHFRLDRQRPRQRDALPLAAGELRRAAGRRGSRAAPAPAARAPRASISASDGRVVARPHPQAERDVLEHRHVPEQRVVLEHEADAAIARVALGRVLAFEQHRCPRRPSPGRR